MAYKKKTTLDQAVAAEEKAVADKSKWDNWAYPQVATDDAPEEIKKKWQDAYEAELKVWANRAVAQANVSQLTTAFGTAKIRG